MTKKTGVICAMKREYKLLTGYGCLTALSGIGKVNAAIAAERLINGGSVKRLISMGVAGTFAEGISEGDIVIAAKTAYHDVWCGEGCAPGQIQGMPQFFESDPTLLALAREALPDAYTGLVCTGDQFFISREEDDRQKALFPEALAIDMEAAAIAQVCHLHDIPFLAVKIISDNHLRPSQKESYDSFWAHLSIQSFEAARKILSKISESE